MPFKCPHSSHTQLSNVIKNLIREYVKKKRGHFSLQMTACDAGVVYQQQINLRVFNFTFLVTGTYRLCVLVILCRSVILVRIGGC